MLANIKATQVFSLRSSKNDNQYKTWRHLYRAHLNNERILLRHQLLRENQIMFP